LVSVDEKKSLEMHYSQESKPLQNVTESPQKFRIYDCRSFTAATANHLGGGGVEVSWYYPFANVSFLSLANIHTMRDSFMALQTACQSSSASPAAFHTALVSSNWLSHIHSILSSATKIASDFSEDGNPSSILIHCSDGWDRTAQISALVQILLDPYYRTIEGFSVLVEKEWVSFGHKFHDRYSVGRRAPNLTQTQTNDTQYEASPIFLQWVDCVYQVVMQYPCAFEFSSKFLIYVLDAVSSSFFGNFFYNSEKEREDADIRALTPSLWLVIQSKKKYFSNLLYRPPSPELANVRRYPIVLLPDISPQKIRFWSEYYMRFYSFHIESLMDEIEKERQLSLLVQASK